MGEGAGTERPHVQDPDNDSPGPQPSTHEGPDALSSRIELTTLV